MKQKLLIINRVQFGYHTDSFKYCQYLKNDFDITYICFYTNMEKISDDGVKIVYVPYKGSFIHRGIGFIGYCRQYIKSNKIDLIFIVYFQMAFLLKLTSSSEKFILDIRTGAVGATFMKRKIKDTIMIFESMFFKNITIISECLRKKLKLKTKKCHILPLGADTLSETDKSFETMKLLYVGTFNSRNIHKTVLGLSDFMKKFKEKNLDITYDIFGSGTTDEENLLLKTISELDLNEIVKFHGRKTHEELKPYFDCCNIGVSYIPITDYYQCQPPTKTFEYINAGLLCIGTSTQENKKLITEKNGVLCIDTIESFSNALINIYSRDQYDSKYIRRTLIDYRWDRIVKQNLLNYLMSILNKRGKN